MNLEQSFWLVNISVFTHQGQLLATIDATKRTIKEVKETRCLLLKEEEDILDCYPFLLNQRYIMFSFRYILRLLQIFLVHHILLFSVQ